MGSLGRILVGMSGGVDSSAAAAMLVDEGYDVIGVTLHLWDYVREGHAGRCCAPEDQYDARRVCDQLGIPHYTFDRRELFRERVVDSFLRDYAEGRTPSPCVRCNEHIKLGPMLALAKKLGADRIATGHYARIRREGHGVQLEMARDRARDQSYFLFAAPMDALRALILPLGDKTKPDVRAYAERLGLTNAQKPDSTDLCFVEGTDYVEWVEAHGVKAQPGIIESTDGRVVGRHDGVHAFTVGQRRGLGAIGGEPKYVLRIVTERNAVVVGSADEAVIARAALRETRWLVEAVPTEVTAKIRYRHPGVRAKVVRCDDRSFELHLAQPQRGVSPGQAAVMYDGDRVVGGGWIA
jgi:tRNA-specific 2-thiouridylase